MANIFDARLDDILFFVDMSFSELLVRYDEEMVQNILQAAVGQNIYLRARTSEDLDDPFNLRPIIEEYSVYERKFK